MGLRLFECESEKCGVCRLGFSNFWFYSLISFSLIRYLLSLIIYNNMFRFGFSHFSAYKSTTETEPKISVFNIIKSKPNLTEILATVWSV